MIYTMLKSSFVNIEPKQLNYRDFKNFSFEIFKEDLRQALTECTNSYETFEDTSKTSLDKYAPKKKKCFRENKKSHVNKMLRKTIMKRSKLKNKANKTKLPVDINNHKKQRNYVVNLDGSAKFEYFHRYDCKDGKPFWVTCKPYFSNKHSKAVDDIVLNGSGELVLKNKEIADTFNTYFGSVVDNLNLQHWNESFDMPLIGVRSKDLNYIINKYSNQPSTKIIKDNLRNAKKFAFQLGSTEDVKKVLKDLRTNKSVGEEIPTQILTGTLMQI